MFLLPFSLLKSTKIINIRANSVLESQRGVPGSLIVGLASKRVPGMFYLPVAYKMRGAGVSMGCGDSARESIYECYVA